MCGVGGRFTSWNDTWVPAVFTPSPAQGLPEPRHPSEHVGRGVCPAESSLSGPGRCLWSRCLAAVCQSGPPPGCTWRIGMAGWAWPRVGRTVKPPTHFILTEMRPCRWRPGTRPWRACCLSCRMGLGLTSQAAQPRRWMDRSWMRQATRLPPAPPGQPDCSAQASGLAASLVCRSPLRPRLLIRLSALGGGGSHYLCVYFEFEIKYWRLELFLGRVVEGQSFSLADSVLWSLHPDSWSSSPDRTPLW